ncbi:MAG TPA: hypothetical protein VIU85_03880 [Chthoniobacterales bacterium]
MKFPLPLVFFGSALFAITALATEPDSLKEKISDFSPDKKFALRTSYDPAIDDGSNGSISKDAIKSVEVIALPDKKVVATLVEGNDGGDIGSIEGKIVWSSDAKWFAYGVSEGHRVIETSAYHWKGDKFEPLQTENLSVDPGGDARNQYITPLRWTKPGTLVLKEFTIFYYNKGDSTFEFTVRFDDAGKFNVINRKKVKSRDE